MLNLAEYRQRPALLADWLPWAGLIAPGVVLNKDGSFQRTARFRGPDLDSATQGELISTSARLNNALRRLGSGWALFIEAERRAAAGYPHSDFPEPLSWLVDEERRAAFEDSGNHFESGYHLTLAYLPSEESRARAAGLLYENRPTEGVDWRERLHAFVAETDRIFDLLDGVMPEIAWLDDSQTLTYLLSTISPRRYRVGVPEVPFHLDALLADAPLIGGLAPMLGDQHLRVGDLLGGTAGAPVGQVLDALIDPGTGALSVVTGLVEGVTQVNGGPLGVVTDLANGLTQVPGQALHPVIGDVDGVLAGLAGGDGLLGGVVGGDGGLLGGLTGGLTGGLGLVGGDGGLLGGVLGGDGGLLGGVLGGDSGLLGGVLGDDGLVGGLLGGDGGLLGGVLGGDGGLLGGVGGGDGRVGGLLGGGGGLVGGVTGGRGGLV